MVNYPAQYSEEIRGGHGQGIALEGMPEGGDRLDKLNSLNSLDKPDRLDRVEAIVEQMAHAVLATTEVVERMGERIDFLSLQVQQQGQQFQQQGYQVYTITDAVQTLIENQADSAKQLNDLMITISHLAKALEHQRK